MIFLISCDLKMHLALMAGLLSIFLPITSEVLVHGIKRIKLHGWRKLLNLLALIYTLWSIMFVSYKWLVLMDKNKGVGPDGLLRCFYTLYKHTRLL